MGSIAGIFDGARENVRRGKASISRVVAVNQQFSDWGESWDDRYKDFITPYNERLDDRLPFGLDHENNWGDMEEMEERDKKEGETVEFFNHELFSDENSVWGAHLGDEEGNHLGIDVLGYDASVDVSGEIGKDKIVVGVNADASAYLINVEAELGAGPATVTADASIGANADATAAVNINLSEGDAKVELGAGGTLGAEANAAGNLDIGIAEAEIGVTGTAGLAADAQLDIGFADGKFEFDVGAKLAFGLGGGFDTSFSVDTVAIGNGAWDAGGWTLDKAGDAGGYTLDKAGDVGGWGVDTAKDIGGKAKDVGGWINPFD